MKNRITETEYFQSSSLRWGWTVKFLMAGPLETLFGIGFRLIGFLIYIIKDTNTKG
jgi:hypothetical protein